MGEGFKIQRSGEPPTPEAPKTYLYKTGDECSALTGGWDYTTNAASGITTRTKETDHLYLQLANPTGTDGSSTATVNAVSLTDKKTLKCKIDLARTGTGTYDRILFTAESTRGGYTAYTISNVVGAGLVVSIDVSELSGNYYIKFDANAQPAKTTTLKVYEVWLE